MLKGETAKRKLEGETVNTTTSLKGRQAVKYKPNRGDRQ